MTELKIERTKELLEVLKECLNDLNKIEDKFNDTYEEIIILNNLEDNMFYKGEEVVDTDGRVGVISNVYSRVNDDFCYLVNFDGAFEILEFEYQLHEA